MSSMESSSRRAFLATVAAVLTGGVVARGADAPDPPTDGIGDRPRSGVGHLRSGWSPADPDRTVASSGTAERRSLSDAARSRRTAENQSLAVRDRSTARDATRARRATTEQIDTTAVVEQEGFRSWRLEFDTSTTIRYNAIVRWGPKVDIILFNDEEYRAFRKGYRARYIGGGSNFHVINVSPSTTVTLSPGTYHVVLNNTSWNGEIPAVEGHTAVEDDMGVHFELTTTNAE